MVNHVNLLHEMLHVVEDGSLALANTEAGSLVVFRLVNMKASMHFLQRGFDPLAGAIVEEFDSAIGLLTTLRHITSNDERINIPQAAIQSSLATKLGENASLAAAIEDARSSIDALRARLATLTSGTQANVGMLSNGHTAISAELQEILDALDINIAGLTTIMQSSFTTFIGRLASSNTEIESTHDTLNTLLARINSNSGATTRAEPQNSTDVLSNLTTSHVTAQSSTAENPHDHNTTTNTVGNIQARVDQLPANTTRLYQRRLEVLEQSVELMRADISEILGLMQNMARVGVPPPYGD